ncbi:GspH/FimT family pseudopilin [Paenactinomyces guangxiensis]|uniref:GspH/FimT family protein n=1 Tax=Paenactinomyces guangxiensis TaxID=1490290 RepID=A0A7W1WNQ8_9BACL|nr:GspH/FimT family protein [Paenactinomyces guangxiensis]MBA4493270.1 GspH/FimT family protein [Paenactinomyces guangxiensis]MBH8589879.1 GspH/FimT family protein [Paenactinomyces guangxiensis]
MTGNGRNRREAGWTLVELILILSLLGLLAMLSLPAFSRIGERAEREMFLHSIASDLQLAQVEAVSRRQEVIVHLDSKNHLITVKQGNNLLRKTTIPPRYQLKSNYPANRIVFRETGQVKGGTLQLYLGGQLTGTIKMQVASGRPKVEMER